MFLTLTFVLVSCAPKRIRLYEDVSLKRKQVVDLSISLIGKPYEAGAKGPSKFDCSGLIHYVFRTVGVILPLTADGLMKVGKDVTNDEVRPGDLVFFREKGGVHVGIMVNRKDFVHASKRKGVGVDSLDSSYWKGRLLGFRSVIF